VKQEHAFMLNNESFDTFSTSPEAPLVDSFPMDDFAHEHEFTADVVSWKTLVIDRDPTSSIVGFGFLARA
jgi:hypothetical protein